MQPLEIIGRKKEVIITSGGKNINPSGIENALTRDPYINQAVVTKLADRGSHQALGIVTDVGLFLRDLAGELCG